MYVLSRPVSWFTRVKVSKRPEISLDLSVKLPAKLFLSSPTPRPELVWMRSSTRLLAARNNRANRNTSKPIYWTIRHNEIMSVLGSKDLMDLVVLFYTKL